MGWLVVGGILSLLLLFWAIGKSQEAKRLRDQQRLQELEWKIKSEPIPLSELEAIKQGMKANYRRNTPATWKAAAIVDDEFSQNL